MKRAEEASSRRVRSAAGPASNDAAGTAPGRSRALIGERGASAPGKPEVRGVHTLSRREIIEELKRQGVQGLSRIKSECRRFERYWLARVDGETCRSDKPGRAF
jgi:hypothetical protein